MIIDRLNLGSDRKKLSQKLCLGVDVRSSLGLSLAKGQLVDLSIQVDTTDPRFKTRLLTKFYESICLPAA